MHHEQRISSTAANLESIQKKIPPYTRNDVFSIRSIDTVVLLFLRESMDAGDNFGVHPSPLF